MERFPERSQTFVNNELLALRARGIEPRVFAMYPPSDAAELDVPYQRLPSIRHETLTDLPRLPSRIGRWARRTSLLARAGERPGRFQLHCAFKALALLDALEGEVPLFLHAHFCRGSASVAMLAAAELGVPFTFTAHGADIFVRPFDLARKLQRAAVSVTVCEYNRRWIEARFGSQQHLVVVPCGVDGTEFSPMDVAPSHPPKIVSVGRLVPKKGFEHLIAACRALADDGIDYECVVVGGGPLADDLTRQVRASGLDGRVRLTGSLSPGAVRAELGTATVFCLPAVVAPDGDRDSQPLVVKEAMAMEIPVVASREVGLPEVVVEGTGLLVTPADPDELAAALATVLTMDPARRRGMGRRGRRFVTTAFSLDRQVDGLIAAWGEAGLDLSS